MTIEEALTKLTRKEVARGLSFALNLKLRTRILRDLVANEDHSQRTVNAILDTRKDEWRVEP